MARRLAYLGTPNTAVRPLRALVHAGHEVKIVVTRPDRRRGRGSATSPSPVKVEADRLGIPVVDDLKALVARLEVTALDLDFGIVVAYGRIVPAALLRELPMLNLHFSLLPRWRGAAPVERAILAGDEITGVCVMALEPELDTGPIFATAVVRIEPGDDADTLRARLTEAGAKLLVDVLAGPLPEARAQTGEPTYAEKITTEELRLTWRCPAAELERVVRLRGAWTTWRDRRLKVLKAEPAPEPIGAAGPAVTGPAPGDAAPTQLPPGPGTRSGHARPTQLPPGALVGDAVTTGTGVLRLLEVQPEGKAPMPAATWLRGARPEDGERLGAS